MARLYLRRTLVGFAPADEASADIAKPRSYQHHKLAASSF